MNRIRSIDLSAEDIWTGGHYEASLVLGNCNDDVADDRLRSAIAAVWATEQFDPKGAGPAKTPGGQRIDLDQEPLEELQILYGQMSHERTGAVPVITSIVRDTEDGPGNDWLYIAIPLSGLHLAFPNIGGWPFGNFENTELWRFPVEKTLADTVLEVSRSVPFKVATIGYEIAGEDEIAELKGDIPSERWVGYVVPKNDKYTYHPTTRWNWS